MSVASQTFAKLQRLARSDNRPFTEYLTLYAMECFLARLARTNFKDDFVLKGGVLLAAYKLRRPTSDIDMEARGFTLDAERMIAVVNAVAQLDDNDALIVNPALTSVTAIRDGDEYSGLRVKISSKVYESNMSFHLDISTGDPIWPEPRVVDVPKLLGGEIRMAGYPMAMVIAEKAVTILTRGASSTRWRDVVDLRNFANAQDFSAREIRTAARHVAAYRAVEIGSVMIASRGWPEAAQTKWAAWRRKFALEKQTRELFADQLVEVAAFLNPIFTGAVSDSGTWSHLTHTWSDV